MPQPLQIDRYRLLRRIGGRQGCRVFEAATADGTRVALKLLEAVDGRLAAPEEEVTRFRREAQVLQRLAHPGIVRLLAHGEESAGAWLAFELLDGPALSSPLQALSMAEALACIDRILDALAHLHAHGVVHRDLKPANVVLDPARGAVLCDFGIAHVQDSLLTQRGDLLGTPAYMAPECFRGEPVDLRSDLFSAGVIAYELLTGHVPFSGANSGEVMLAVVQEEPLPASRINPALSPAMDEVLATALAKPRERRFDSARAFASALRRAAAQAVASAG